VEVDGWLARAAASRPGRVAVQTPAESITYAHLQERALDFARWLAAEGIGPGDRVALALPAGVEFAVALHACLLLGAPVVPVDLRLSAAERGQVTASTRLTIEAEGLTPWGRLTTHERPGCRSHQGASGSAAAPEVGSVHDLDAVAAVIHTSGTTGTAKAVELTFGNWLWSALGSATALGLDPRERWLCTLPLAHVGGLSILVRSAIYATTAVVHERFDTEAVLGALGEGGITVASLVATTLGRLLDAGVRDPGSLRCALVGGGPVAPALLERAREAGVVVCQTYGLTEACSQVTTAPPSAPGGPAGSRAGADPGAGPPLFCTRVGIAPDGEILVRGPTVGPGTLAPDGWLHTGDLGEIDGGGCLHVTGRREDTIVSGGENVSPREVEEVLEEHHAVAEAAVVGRADPEWGEAVTAIVVLRHGARLEPEELRRLAAARLAPFKVPKAFVFTDGPLPRTPSGKLLRRELA